MKVIIHLSVFILLNSCCGTYCKYEVYPIGQETRKYRFNIVGILGEESDTAYVEVWYSEATEDGKNRVVHKWVKPPVIIGGHYSNVTVNKVESNRGGYGEHTLKNYLEGKSHYMKIVNHSSEPIEFFIAGTQPVKMLDLEGYFDGQFENGKTAPSMEHMYLYPIILYNKAPIYYLLYPNEKPEEDKYEYFMYFSKKYSYEVDEEKFVKMNFSGNQIGDIIVDDPWSIEQVMELYRKEYNNAQGTLKFKLLTDKDPQSDYTLSKYESKKYYGKVLHKDTLVFSDRHPTIIDRCDFVDYTSLNNYGCLYLNRH